MYRIFSIQSFSTIAVSGHLQFLKLNFWILCSQQTTSCFLLPFVKAGHIDSMFCTLDFDRLAALLCCCNGLMPLFFPDYHCTIFHVFLLSGSFEWGRVFLRLLPKIHIYSMERFSHLEIEFGKYAISWGAYKLNINRPEHCRGTGLLFKGVCPTLKYWHKSAFRTWIHFLATSHHDPNVL